MIQETSTPISCNCHPPEVKISFLNRYRDFLLSTNTLATVGNGILLFAGLIADWVLRMPVPANVLYISATLVGGGPIFLLAARGIMKRDLTAGVMVSVAMIAALLIGEYSAAAIVAFMMMFGEMLENFTMARANDALKNLARLIPNFVTLLRDGQPTALPIEQVRTGDTLLVRNGERVPVDGVILKGQAALDESTITGEAVPVDKKSGDTVFAGTMNTAGTLEIQAQKLGRDTTLGTIVKLVEEAQKSQAPVQRLANKYAQYLVPITFSIAALVYFITGEVVRAVTVLVVVCPCALVLATPTALVAAIGNAARKNAIVKTGASVEALGKVDCVAFDKTGTLTLGKPRVAEVVALDSLTPDQILSFAAAAESCSEHPLGKAIVAHANARGLPVVVPQETEVLTGFGVRAKSDGREIIIGNRDWLSSSGIPSANHAARIEELEARGHTVIPVVVNRAMVGLLALSDQARPEAQAALRALKAVGIKRTVLISGDNAIAVKTIATQLGVDEYHAQVLPDQKLVIIKQLQQQGLRVAYVGDGVNDAPALKAAHIGIAMGGRGTDVAREAAALVLLDDNFASIVRAVRMGRRIFDNLRKAMTFIFSVHIPIAGMSLLPILFKLPLALLPIHIVFLELVIDPACSIAFETERDEADIMQRPPRRLEEPLFGREMILTGLVQGLGVLAIVLGVFVFVLSRGLGEFEARMLSFSTLVIANLGLIFSNRSRTRSILQILRTPNPALWLITAFTVVFLTLAIFVPFLRDLFSFGTLHLWEVVLVAGMGGLSILIAESVKLRQFWRAAMTVRGR